MVIETDRLTKYYGSKLGCKDITVSVAEGEIFGLLGPNGAGKSTFVKMLVGLIFPDSGSAFLLGRPLGDVDVRRRIGYLPENFRYQDWMTGGDLLSFHASLYKLDKKQAAVRASEVLDLVRLKGNEKYRIGTYSKGMQQRIGIACALLPDPDILFLDEPTSALDPIGRKEVREIMLDLKARGKTVLLNSHLLSEVETICDSIAFINRGTIIRQSRMEDLQSSRITLDIRAENINPVIIEALGKIGAVTSGNDGRLTLNIRSMGEIPAAAAIIVENGGKLYELTPHRESLENIFISLMEGGAGK